MDTSKKIPTHDPYTGELNPYYEELTGEKNPLSIKYEENFSTDFKNRFIIKLRKLFSR